MVSFGVIAGLIGFFGWRQPVLADCSGSLRCFNIDSLGHCQTETSHNACNGTTQWTCESASEDDCPCGVMSGGTCSWSSCTPVNGTWGSWSSCYPGGGGLCVHDRTCIGASCGGSDWEECAAGSCTSPSCSNCGTYPNCYDPWCDTGNCTCGCSSINCGGGTCACCKSCDYSRCTNGCSSIDCNGGVCNCIPGGTTCEGCSPSCGEGTQKCTNGCDTWYPACNNGPCCDANAWGGVVRLPVVQVCSTMPAEDSTA